MIFSPCSNLLCGLITTENLTKKPPQKLHKISPYARDTLAQPALSKSLLNPDVEGTQAHFSAVFALPALQRCPAISAASGTSVGAPPCPPWCHQRLLRVTQHPQLRVPGAEAPNSHFAKELMGFSRQAFLFLAGIFGERNWNILKNRSPNLAAVIFGKVFSTSAWNSLGKLLHLLALKLPRMWWWNGRRRQMCKTIR